MGNALAWCKTRLCNLVTGEDGVPSSLKMEINLTYGEGHTSQEYNSMSFGTCTICVAAAQLILFLRKEDFHLNVWKI